VENWLALNEYANKHQVSISTLRRRIKSNKIKYKLDDGKYFLEDDSLVEGVSIDTPMKPKRLRPAYSHQRIFQRRSFCLKS